jgi:hypothetical protein
MDATYEMPTDAPDQRLLPMMAKVRLSFPQSN